MTANFAVSDDGWNGLEPFDRPVRLGGGALVLCAGRPMPHFDQPENLRDRRKRPDRAVFRLDRPRIAAKRRSEPARRGIFDRLSEGRSAIGRPALPLYVPQSGPPAIARRRRHAGGLLRPAARKGNAAESSLYPRDHAAIAAVDVFRDQQRCIRPNIRRTTAGCPATRKSSNGSCSLSCATTGNNGQRLSMPGNCV